MIRVGRMTALRKADGGVRGIVAGDVIRRLVARTISQQLSQTVEPTTVPFQYALSRTTVVSTDGINAYDQISWAGMLSGLLNVEGGGFCHSFGCSTAHPLQILGKIRVVFLTHQAGGRRRVYATACNALERIAVATAQVERIRRHRISRSSTGHENLGHSVGHP